jgi:hypothetical protein
VGRHAAGAVAIGLSLAAAVASASPGTLTSAAELAVYRAAADAGTQPQKDDRTRMVSEAHKTWAWGTISGAIGTTGTPSSKKCQPLASSSGADYLLEGAPDAYAQAIGSFLAPDQSLAQQARTHVLDLVDTSGFAASPANTPADNQCVLDLSLSIPCGSRRRVCSRTRRCGAARIPRRFAAGSRAGVSEGGVGEPHAAQQLGRGGFARVRTRSRAT